MFGFGTVLVGAGLAAWVAVSIGYAVRYYAKGYGPRSFVDEDFIRRNFGL